MLNPQLQSRVGRALLAQRVHLQSHYAARMLGHGLTYTHIENMLWLHWLLRLGLKLTGVYWWGRRNALAIRVRTNTIPIQGLSPEFEGFTILQLSDLHLDMNPDFVDAVVKVVRPLAYDLAVITGDFRARTHGTVERAVGELARLRPELKGDVYGVLGNHDSIEMLLPMEATGIRFLMNEHVLLRRGAGMLCLAGVDDPHFYETDNVQNAAAHLEHQVPAVLLAHSPEIYRKAAAAGFQAVICGHTHGGQICLPGGIPMLINARAPLRMVKGRWLYRGMHGYTSTGTGTSGVDVRYFCPPEVVLHTLVRLGERGINPVE